MGRKDDDVEAARSVRASAADAAERLLARSRLCAPSGALRILWVTALLLSVVLLHRLAAPSSSSTSPSLADSAALASVLLDGRDIAKPLPTVFPNGAAGAHRCDLPALRYQCDLDSRAGCRAYPQLFPARELLTNWSPDAPEQLPEHTFESICRFNLSIPYELQLAHMFHQMEVPFVAYGIPELTRASERWTEEYLTQQLQPEQVYKVHVANNSHFMYFAKNVAKPDEPPTYASMWWTYQQFLEAVAASKSAAPGDHKYYYLQLKAADIEQRARFVYDDLAFMDPKRVLLPDATLLAAYGNMFIRDVQDTLARGMRCRFGMQGIITEGHIDTALNMIAMVRGSKRYIISPPSVCSCLDLLTSGPSARHTRLDWSNLSSLPEHALECPTTEVVVREGDVLYMPSYWYHHIVSLDESIQCNVRSGIITRTDVTGFLGDCGFAV